MYRIVLIIFVLPFNCIAQVSNQAIINVYVGAQQCIGSVIHQRWILTSASCFAYGQPSNGLTVSVGYNNYGVEQAVIHSSYVPNNPDYDIALIRLNEDVLNINGYQPLDFNEGADYRGQTLFTNIGQLPAVDESYCAEYTSNHLNLICALGQPGQNCYVAAGTPIFFNNRQIGLRTGTYQCDKQAQPFIRISRHADWLMNQLAIYGNQILQ